MLVVVVELVVEGGTVVGGKVVGGRVVGGVVGATVVVASVVAGSVVVGGRVVGGVVVGALVVTGTEVVVVDDVGVVDVVERGTVVVDVTTTCARTSTAGCEVVVTLAERSAVGSESARLNTTKTTTAVSTTIINVLRAV